MPQVSDIRRVAVGLSGGVDSSVAAALLAQEGHDVIGVTMRIWDGRPLPGEGNRHACYGPSEKEDIADSARVANILGIPFHVVDLANEYNERVLGTCSRIYRAGMTPNPCTRCNARIKFELIPERLRQIGLEVDAFATGHYARLGYDTARARHVLYRARDHNKDQSYFLYQLTQTQLATTLLPLGERDKTEVRDIAHRLGLPVADKAESQDFAAGGLTVLFGHEGRPGPILDTGGKVIGEHRGVHFYTVGQRRGLGIAAPEPLYVISIDAVQNALVVGPAERTFGESFTVAEINWIAIKSLPEPMRVSTRIRHRHTAVGATITPAAGGRVRVDLDTPQQAITPGQAAVFYDGDRVIGGGIIQPGLARQ